MTKPTDGFGLWLWVLAWGAGIVPGCALAVYRTTRQLPRPVDEAKQVHPGNPGIYFPLNPPELAELCERDAATFVSYRGVWTSQWSDRSVIHGANRPAASFAWAAVRLPDGTVCSGKYSTKVAYFPGSWASSPSVTIDEFHLLDRLRPPPAEPGWVGIVPGEYVIISPDPGSSRQFLADLPGDHDIRFEVSSSEGDVDIRVSRDNAVLPHRVTDGQGSVEVHARTAGTYRVVVAERAPLKVPAVIHMDWGARGHRELSLEMPIARLQRDAAGSPDGGKQPGRRRTNHE
jgi:hypothetical protein